MDKLDTISPEVRTFICDLINQIESEIERKNGIMFSTLPKGYGKSLATRNYQLECTLRQILKYCNYLHNDCKYRLDDGHIRKIRKICRDVLKGDQYE